MKRRARRPRSGEAAPLPSRVIDGLTDALGRPYAVAAAATLVVLWLGFGPLFHFSDTYQLIINTTTTIITFVMVFAIQHTTNRETRAINLKLDELLEALDGANEKLVGVETKSDAAIKKLQKREVAKAHTHMHAHGPDTAPRTSGRRRSGRDAA